MRETFLNIKNSLFGRKNTSMMDHSVSGSGMDYVELDADASKETRKRIQVRQFVMETFEDIKDVLDALRDGYTIALVNIQPLKDKDIVELKRAVNKLKKTCDAIQGDIAGFGEDYIVATPEVASIYRQSSSMKSEESGSTVDEDFE